MIPVGTERVWVDKPMGITRRQVVTLTRTLDVTCDHSALLASVATDRSAKVRRLAADHIVTHGFESVGPDIGTLLALDRDPGVADRLAFARRKWAGATRGAGG